MPKENKEQITLCHSCLEDCIYADRKIEKDHTVKVKEPCDKCGRMGWTYLIVRDKHAK